MFSRLKALMSQPARPTPRFAPNLDLPPYAFVPRFFPHPVRNPKGHSYQREFNFGTPPRPDNWLEHEGYQYALDLFNHGFYWEAHEAFESWWHQLPKDDSHRLLFQGLLRLCAAGVKVRQGMPAGIHSHATKAATLLQRAHVELDDSPTPHALGLPLAPIQNFCENLALKAHLFAQSKPLQAVEVVWSLRLEPFDQD